MAEITDELMKTELAKVRQFTLVLLKRGPNYGTPESQPIVYAHGKRNMGMRLDGTMPLVGPVRGGDSGIVGISVFDKSLEEVREIMDGDPGVQAGLFLIEMYPWITFPGDALPVAGGAPVQR